MNKGGNWYKPSHLNPSQWKNIPFKIDWEALVKMYELRKYYVQIAPPFSKYAAPRVAEQERLTDDLLFYHVKRSWYHLAVWMVFTTFFIDLDDMDGPGKHWRADNRTAQTVSRVRKTPLKDDK